MTLVYYGQTAGRISMKLSVDVGLSREHIVLDGDPAPLHQRGTGPQFLAHICCGQMAGFIKMLLGIDVGFGLGDFVLDGDPARPSPKRWWSPQFSAHAYCDQTAGLYYIWSYLKWPK